MRTSAELTYISSAGPETSINELDVVRLTQPVIDRDGRHIASGSRGTVVAIYPDGLNCEIEFTTPFEALATVEIASLETS